MRHWTYAWRNFIYRVAPGRTGLMRRLRSAFDPGYVHDRDKHPVRNKHHGGGGWKAGEEGPLRHRDYGSYDEYVAHQEQKFTEMLKMKGGFTGAEILAYRQRFYRRFRHLPELLPSDAVIVCAGARQGTEVEVLRDLGFRNAWGIDLNPGPDNPLVKKGDFMHMENASGSVDLLYSNCLDHAFDLKGFFREHGRVLKPDGYALYDFVPSGGTGAFEAVEWASEDALFTMFLRHFNAIVHVETEEHWKWVLLRGPKAIQADGIQSLIDQAKRVF